MSNFSRTLTAWLSIGSTYTYLTALRLEEKKKSENLDLLIKPFSKRNIMRIQNNISSRKGGKNEIHVARL